MGRLIDANELIEEIRKSKESKKGVVRGIVLEVCDITHEHIIEITEIQPTAFNLNKVEEEIQNFMNDQGPYCRENIELGACENFESCKACKTAKIIDIVRKGGVE